MCYISALNNRQMYAYRLEFSVKVTEAVLVQLGKLCNEWAIFVFVVLLRNLPFAFRLIEIIQRFDDSPRWLAAIIPAVSSMGRFASLRAASRVPDSAYRIPASSDRVQRFFSMHKRSITVENKAHLCSSEELVMFLNAVPDDFEFRLHLQSQQNWE